MKLKYRVIERFRGKYSVEAMCEVFEVSRSGYYAWRKRQERAAKDQWLADLMIDTILFLNIFNKAEERVIMKTVMRNETFSNNRSGI